MRNPIFDIMKGIAMIMVIMAHTLPFAATRPLSSFWSTLFFIVSGYFAKNQKFKDYIIKDSRRLIIPYAASCIFMIPFIFLGNFLFNVNAWPMALKSMLAGSSSFSGELAYINIGPLWFVCALFIVRSLWSLMSGIKNDIAKGLLIFILGIAAWKAKQYITLPWSILSAIGAMGFYFAGYLFQKYNLFYSSVGKRIAPIALAALLFCVTFGYTNANLCIYKGWYIIDVIGGIGAFITSYALISHFSDINNRIWRFLNFFGRYSLVAFAIHAIDQCLNVHWFPFKIWDQFSAGYEQACVLVIRIAIVAMGCKIVSRIPFIKEKIFFIKGEK